MAVAGTIGQKTFDDDLKSLAKLAEEALQNQNCDAVHIAYIKA